MSDNPANANAFSHAGMVNLESVAAFDGESFSPSNIVASDEGAKIRVKWGLDQQVPVKDNHEFHLTVYFENLSGERPGPRQFVIPANAGDDAGNYEFQFKVEPGDLPPGIYRVTTLLVYDSKGEFDQPLAAFFELVLQVFSTRF